MKPPSGDKPSRRWWLCAVFGVVALGTRPEQRVNCIPPGAPIPIGLKLRYRGPFQTGATLIIPAIVRRASLLSKNWVRFVAGNHQAVPLQNEPISLLIRGP